jgi:hypothetical protein
MSQTVQENVPRDTLEEAEDEGEEDEGADGEEPKGAEEVKKNKVK